MIKIAPLNNNKKETIKQKSQCHSSSTKISVYRTALATILEDTVIINTIADSAATGHFFPNKDSKNNNHNGIQVFCANNQSMDSGATTELTIPELSKKASTVYHLNETEQPLLSISLLADDGYKINLTAFKL
jgi:hypothetical protein